MLSSLDLKLWLKKRKGCYRSYSHYIHSICVYTCSNCLYKFNLKISRGSWFSHFRKGKGNPLGSHTNIHGALRKEKKKAQTLLQNTVYSMFQAVLCLLHNASNSRLLGDLHQIPCRWSPTLCQCLYRSTTDWMLERSTKRDWLMERHFLLYFEFCICYFSSAKMQWRIL